MIKKSKSEVGFEITCDVCHGYVFYNYTCHGYFWMLEKARDDGWYIYQKDGGMASICELCRTNALVARNDARDKNKSIT